MVSTNMYGRGVDFERVNVVFNYDMPSNETTYLHRYASLFLFPFLYPSWF